MLACEWGIDRGLKEGGEERWMGTKKRGGKRVYSCAIKRPTAFLRAKSSLCF